MSLRAPGGKASRSYSRLKKSPWQETTNYALLLVLSFFLLFSLLGQHIANSAAPRRKEEGGPKSTCLGRRRRRKKTRELCAHFTSRQGKTGIPSPQPKTSYLGDPPPPPTWASLAGSPTFARGHGRPPAIASWVCLRYGTTYFFFLPPKFTDFLLGAVGALPLVLLLALWQTRMHPHRCS